MVGADISRLVYPTVFDGTSLIIWNNNRIDLNLDFSIGKGPCIERHFGECLYMVFIIPRQLIEQNCSSISPFSFIIPATNFPTLFGQFIHRSFPIFPLRSPSTISLLFLGKLLSFCLISVIWNSSFSSPLLEESEDSGRLLSHPRCFTGNDFSFNNCKYIVVHLLKV